jgi:hypothetical protein
MAFGTVDFGIGTVEVRYNGTPVLNIHSTRIQIQNDSNSDLTDLEVNVRFSEGTWVLRSFGSVTQSVQQLPPTEEYQAALKSASEGKLTPQALAHLGTLVDHRIPVLNRGAVATFTIFTSRQDYATPVVNVGSDHLGVRLIHRTPVPEVFGVRRSLAQFAGTLLSVAAVVTGIYFGLNPWVTGIGGWLTGAGVLAIGAGMVHIARMARKALG